MYDGNRYLALVCLEKYDGIYNNIRYLISQKSGITYIDSYNSLPIKRKLTLHNVVVHIKSVLNKDQNHCYYNIFLEK